MLPERGSARFRRRDANLYAYTFNSPTNFTDPTGQIVPVVAVPLAQCLKGAGFDVGTSLLESLLGGRKRPSMGDLLKAALAGCLSDVFNPLDRLGDAARLAKEAAERMPNRRASKELVDEMTNGGRKPLSREDAETVLDWAAEPAIAYPGARAKPGDVASPSNWNPNPVPHIHIPGAGRNGHVPVHQECGRGKE